MIIPWNQVLRLPQTYFFLIGIGLGYGVFLIWQGFRPLVLIGGGILILGAIAFWFWQLRLLPTTTANSDNLLQREIFINQLNTLENKLPNLPESTWTKVKNWAQETQEFAENIVQREPVLSGDLLETLYTVIDLSAQVVEALLVIQQMQTPTYRSLAQERLKASCDRLQETHHQLQYLQDQITLWSLEQRAANTANLPNHLRLLIADNKTILQTPPEVF